MTGDAAVPPVSYEDQASELKRELAQRRRVFPTWVAQGKLERLEADRRLRRMEAALATVEAAAAAGRLL